jgi:hypothetical protein
MRTRERFGELSEKLALMEREKILEQDQWMNADYRREMMIPQ